MSSWSLVTISLARLATLIPAIKYAAHYILDYRRLQIFFIIEDVEFFSFSITSHNVTLLKSGQ